MMDYKETDGVLFPQTLMIGGIFPVPVKVELNSFKLNSGLDNALFSIQ
ncbi:MAG: hypothetical protein IPL65_20120 [Lewinellaceae bacterium]|nr:hypothetical protein [Lewinellaceae bacterium]